MERQSNIPVTNSSQRLIINDSDSMNREDSEIAHSNSQAPVLANESEDMLQISKQHFYTVAVLCFINLINYMDRFTIAGVLPELQSDFNVNDSKAGLLQTAFVFSYMIFAPIFGYFGDRYSRKFIMGFGIALWSTTTLVGSFMPNYYSFITFRALVGIGEASYSTIAPTIISDLFVKSLRSKFLAVFYFAIPVGSGLGYIVGSGMATMLGNWRWALRLTPLLGLVAVVLLVFCIEPKRGESEGSHLIASTSYTEDLNILVKNRSFILSTAGFTCVAFVAGALAWWAPTYMHLGIKIQDPNTKITLSDVSFNFGVVTMLSGIIGVPLGSYFSQRFIKAYPRCDPYICAIGLILSAPLMAGALVCVTQNVIVTYLLIFLSELSLNLTWAIVADILLYVVVPTRRSTAEAFQILISHALGDAGSPYFIGLLSDMFQGMFHHVKSAAHALQLSGTTENVLGLATSSSSLSPLEIRLEEENDEIKFKSLQYAMLMTCFVEVIGAIFFFLTANHILRDRSNAEKSVTDSQLSAVNLPSNEPSSDCLRPIFDID